MKATRSYKQDPTHASSSTDSRAAVKTPGENCRQVSQRCRLEEAKLFVLSNDGLASVLHRHVFDLIPLAPLFCFLLKYRDATTRLLKNGTNTTPPSGARPPEM
jgi:hypothetical protein